MQRLAGQLGYKAIIINTDAAPEKPAFALFGSTMVDGHEKEREREVVLAIRGTASLQVPTTSIR